MGWWWRATARANSPPLNTKSKNTQNFQYPEQGSDLSIARASRGDPASRFREQLLRNVEGIADDLDDKIAGTGQLLFGLARVPVVVVLELVVWAFEAGVYARAAELSWRTAAAISAVANLASLAAGWWVSSR